VPRRLRGHEPPRGSVRSVSQTADAERNLPELLRELCARRDNHVFIGVAGVLRSTSPQAG
jgi:hypothetical protein